MDAMYFLLFWKSEEARANNDPRKFGVIYGILFSCTHFVLLVLVHNYGYHLSQAATAYQLITVTYRFSIFSWTSFSTWVPSSTSITLHNIVVHVVVVVVVYCIHLPGVLSCRALRHLRELLSYQQGPQVRGVPVVLCWGNVVKFGWI